MILSFKTGEVKVSSSTRNGLYLEEHLLRVTRLKVTKISSLNVARMRRMKYFPFKKPYDSPGRESRLAVSQLFSALLEINLYGLGFNLT